MPESWGDTAENYLLNVVSARWFTMGWSECLGSTGRGVHVRGLVIHGSPMGQVFRLLLQAG